MYEYLQPFEKHRYSYVINIANIAIINFVLVTVFLFEYNKCFPFFTHPASTPGFFRSQNSRWRGGSPVIAYTAEEQRQFLPLKWDWQRWISFCLPCTNARNRCSVARVPCSLLYICQFLELCCHNSAERKLLTGFFLYHSLIFLDPKQHLLQYL